MTDPSAGDERMQRRVRELLDRAEDFRRHGEDGSADAALSLAENIMIKYSIDAAVIAARRAAGGVVEEIITRTVEFTGIYRVALVVKFDQLVRAFTTNVRSFISKGERVETLHLVGYESDVQQLQTLITSVNLQAIASLNVWWQNYPDRAALRGMDGYKTRRQYVSSFVVGAADRIETARKTALGNSAPGTELVLRDRKSAVDAHVAATYQLFNRQTRLDPGRQDAADAGRAAGRRANTGDTPVGTKRRQITS